MAHKSTPRTVLIAVAAALMLGAAGNAFSDVTLKTTPSKKPESSYDLLDPLKNMLTGRAWLMLEGIDPGLRRRPGWDTLTRMDWQKLDIGSPFLGGTGMPSLQAAGTFLVPYRNPAPAFSRNILISRDYSSSPIQTEPHIAVNPADPDHAVVGMIDYNFPSITSYVTMDGGVSWDGPFQGGYLPDDRVSGGDPVLAFDRKGNVYMTSISIGVEEFSIGPLVTSSMVSSIAVARSQDGGYTWPTIISTDRSSVEISNQQIDPGGRLRGSLSIGFLDKPWLAVGVHPQDATRDVIYVTYTDFIVYYEIIYTGELPILLPRDMASTISLVTSEDDGLT